MATLSARQEFTATVAGLTLSTAMAAGGVTNTAVSLFSLDNAATDVLLALRFTGDASAGSTTPGPVTVYYQWFNQTGTASASVVSLAAANMYTAFAMQPDADNTQLASTRITVDGNILGIRMTNSASGCVSGILNIIRANIKDSQA